MILPDIKPVIGDQETIKKKMVKTLYIVNNLSLRSFTVLSKDGKEQNALSHSSIIEELQRNCDFIETILSKK